MRPLVTAALAGTMAMMAFVAVVGPVVRALLLPEWVAGVAVTSGGVLWLLLARWWGHFSDWRGRKPVLLIGFGAFFLAYVVLAVGTDLALRGAVTAIVGLLVLVIARALIGAFYAAVPPTAAAVIADHTTPPERGPAMATLGSANALGMVLGPLLAGWIASRNLALSLYVAAALPLLGFVVIAFFLPRNEPTAARRPHGRARMSLLDTRLRTATLTAFTVMFAVATAQVLVGFIAIDRLHLTVAEGARAAGMALTAVGCAQVVAQQLVARLKTITLRHWIPLGALVAGLGFLAVATVHGLVMLLACYAVMALGMGLLFPNFQALAANAVEAHEQGAAAGTLSAAQGLGMIAGPLIATLIYKAGPAVPYVLVGLALWALAGFTFWRLRPQAEVAP